LVDCKAEARRKASWPVLAIAAFATVATWAVPFVTAVPGDYRAFLLPWYQHIVETGRIAAFAHPFANYAPPYLYLLSLATLLPLPPMFAIKLLSAVGAVWLAYAVYRLAGVEAAAWSFLLPTVVINVPILAQADPFWVAPCALSVCAALRGDTLWTAIWAGVGFAFKAQAIFIAPFVFGVLARAPLHHWLAPLGVYVASMLPAGLIGWPVSDLITIYFSQAHWARPGSSAFISTAPNLWAVLGLDHAFAASHFWLGFAFATVATLLYLRAFRRFDRLGAAALSAAMLPFLLPGMHERFFALAEILTFCIAWQSHRIAVAALMQAALIAAIAAIVLHSPPILVFGAFVELTAILLLLRESLCAPTTFPSPPVKARGLP
jgi:Gpi18-like mannosyltransferase